MNRRAFLSSLSSLPLFACASRASSPSSPPPSRPLELFEAPSNLGLRPPREGHQPGTWQAPQVLVEAGLARRVRFARHAKLPRPPYSFEAQPGTGIRNGHTLRDTSLQLAALVEDSLQRGALPVVVGGDCSILLGCLVGQRRAGGRGVVHVDGHSDFIHAGNFDLSTRLATAAGMDLALATGRGEALLTAWPEIEGPLVADEDVLQIGERESDDPAFYKDIAATKMARLTVQEALAQGLPATTARLARHLEERGLDRAWLHLDLDVLDEQIMPAVDSPGRPGFDYAQLGELVHAALATGRIAGLDVAIYDPDLDPARQYAPRIVEMLAAALA